MKRKIISLSVTAILALSMILTGCKAKDSTKEQETQSVNNLIESALESINNNSEAAKALNCKVDSYTYNEADITCYIALNQDKASISGDGAGFKDGILTINSAGTYKISGQLNGIIEIDASKDDTVNIILDGVDISCDSYAPFTVWQADKTIVYLNEDTTNESSDATEYTTLSGTTDDDEKGFVAVENGDINISANSDGKDVNGSILMEGGTVYVDGPQNDVNEIISYEPAKSFNAIVISTEELKTGETYEVLVDGETYTTVTL